MARTYIFADATGAIVLRTDNSVISHLPWPLPSGFSHDLWVADGSPTPAAFVFAPTTNDVRMFLKKRLIGGFNDSGAGNTGKAWSCDDVTTLRLTALGATAGFAAGTPPTSTPAGPFQLVAMDGSIVSLTAAQTYALVQRMMAWYMASVLYSQTMQNNILAGNPPADITVGWP